VREANCYLNQGDIFNAIAIPEILVIAIRIEHLRGDVIYERDSQVADTATVTVNRTAFGSRDITTASAG